MPIASNPMQPFLDAIAPVIADEMGWVTPSLPRFVQQTITQRYSKDRPLELVSDVAGTGTAYMPLPVAPVGQFGVFDPLFSEVKKIEYPIGQIPDEDVRSEDWELYRSPTGYQLVLSAYVPQVGQSARITWTARHAPDATTVDPGDFYAVCDYAASLALEAMAARASQIGDSTMGADTVNYRSKAQEFTSLAAKIRKRYYNHMGVDEAPSGVESKAAISVGNLRNIMGTAGVDRLVHGKDTR
jgi:hypothetical protein